MSADPDLAYAHIDLSFNDGASRRPFFHRNTPADNGAMNQVLRQQDYSFDRLRRGTELAEAYRRIVSGNKTPLIIDAGANIGASAVWFAGIFSRAHVVAIEPDRNNVVLLRRNTAGLPVTVIEAALGATDGRSDLSDPGFGEWGYRTTDNPDGSIVRIGMTGLVAAQKALGRVPYVAKIDIEGGEADLFSSATEWIADFPLIIIELHDWLIAGKATSGTFLRAISQYDRDFVHLGENIFSIANPLYREGG